MKFKKMHGAGNDYVFVDARNKTRDWPKVAAAVSDRHKGIGSDGLIILLPSEKADVRMQMFNADGSEGEMCGNGIRCFVRFALDVNALNLSDRPVRGETRAGIVPVTPLWNGEVMTRASVSMGPPRLVPADIPLVVEGKGPVVDHELEIAGHKIVFTGVSMGNPHAVTFIDIDVDDYPLHEIGPIVESHSMFPNKVNFEIVNVLSRHRLKVRVWERGSGLTQACGTGACAVVVAARLKGLVSDNVTIDLPGGSLDIQWPGDGDVIMEGPVEESFDGDWRG